MSPVSYFFHDDIFVSYSRKDGSGYAAALVNQLVTKFDFKVFYDQYGTRPQNTIPPGIIIKIKRAKMFILVASDEALKSEHVKDEVIQFIENVCKKKEGTFLCVDLGNWKSTNWVIEKKYHTIYSQSERTEIQNNLFLNTPSQKVVDFVCNSYSYKKQNEKIRKFTILSLIILGLTSSAIIFLFDQLSTSRKEINKNEATISQQNQDILKRTSDLKELRGKIVSVESQLSNTEFELTDTKIELSQKQTLAKELDKSIQRKNKGSVIFYEAIQNLSKFDNIRNIDFRPFVLRTVIPQLYSTAKLDTANKSASNLLNTLINKTAALKQIFNFHEAIKKMELPAYSSDLNHNLLILTEKGNISLFNISNNATYLINNLAKITDATLDSEGENIAYIGPRGDSIKIAKIIMYKEWDVRRKDYSPWQKKAVYLSSLDISFPSIKKMRFDNSGKNLAVLFYNRKFKLYNLELTKSIFQKDSIYDFQFDEQLDRVSSGRGSEYLVLAVGDKKGMLELYQKSDLKNDTSSYSLNDRVSTTDNFLTVTGINVSNSGDLIWIKDDRDIPNIGYIVNTHKLRRTRFSESDSKYEDRSEKFSNLCMAFSPYLLNGSYGYVFLNKCGDKINTLHFYSRDGLNTQSEVMRLMHPENIIEYAMPIRYRKIYVASGTSIFEYDLDRLFNTQDTKYPASKWQALIEERTNFAK